MYRPASPRLCVFALLLGATAVSANDRKPNLLLFIADDQHRASVGCYGRTPSHTPAIDRLAAEGMRFDRAFTPSAMCTPSRSCLFTGLNPMRHGAHPNHAKMKPGVQTLADWLKAAGYRTALYGKEGARPFTPGVWDDQAENTLKVPGSPENCDFDWPRVEKFMTGDPAKPFLLVLSTNFPHAPYMEPGGYDASDKFTDGELGAALDLVKKHGLDGNTIVVYVSDNGAGIPRAKWTVYDAGCLLPLIVRWPGRVKPGAATDAMVSFIDVAPSLLEAAGVPAPLYQSPSAPVAEGHGTGQAAGLDGRSFLGVLDGKSDRHRDEIFLTQTSMGVNNVTAPYPSRAIRTETHKYILNLNPGVPHPMTKEVQPAEELYRIDRDPDETKNVIADPAEKDVLEELRAKLAAWMQSQGDGGMEGEKKIPARILGEGKNAKNR